MEKKIISDFSGFECNAGSMAQLRGGQNRREAFCSGVCGLDATTGGYCTEWLMTDLDTGEWWHLFTPSTPLDGCG
jgi:hypothetical protein